MLTYDGNHGALQILGTPSSTSFTFSGKIQEADNATATFFDIAGATFPAVTSTTGTLIVNSVSFQRTRRFLRYIGTIGGTTPTVPLDAMFLGQQKQL